MHTYHPVHTKEEEVSAKYITDRNELYVTLPQRKLYWNNWNIFYQGDDRIIIQSMDIWLFKDETVIKEYQPLSDEQHSLMLNTV